MPRGVEETEVTLFVKQMTKHTIEDSDIITFQIMYHECEGEK